MRNGRHSSCDSTAKEFVSRVPAVYLGSAEGAILAFLLFYRFNNLSAIMERDEFESRPAH